MRITKGRFLLILFLLSLISQGSLAVERHALLIGIGDYKNGLNPLVGPPEDVKALAEVLTRQWGFELSHIHKLINSQATRTAILDAIKGLEKDSHPGDEILIYFSGHGTGRKDPRNPNLNLPAGSGAIVPADFQASTPEEAIKRLIVGRTDLQPLLKRLDKDRQVLVIFDSCFSGQAVRSWSVGTGTARGAAIRLPADLAEGIADGNFNTEKKRAYPYEHVFYLAASGDWEIAWDIDNKKLIEQYPTRDKRFHGAFTDALLRSLYLEIPVDLNHDQSITWGELAEATRQYLAQSGVPQSPQVLPVINEDKSSLRGHPLFGSGQPATGSLEQPTQSADVAELLVDVVGPNNSLRQAVAAVEGVKVSNQRPELQVRLEKGQIKLFSTNNHDYPITTFNSQDTDLLKAQLVRRVQWRRWIGQVRGSQSFGVSMGLRRPGQSGTLVQGEILDIAVKSERRGWLLLMNLSPEGEITVLYPATQQEADNPLEAGEVREGFINVRVKEPFGIDHLVTLVLTNQPQHFEQMINATFNAERDALTSLNALIQSNQGKAAVTELQLATYPNSK